MSCLSCHIGDRKYSAAGSEEHVVIFDLINFAHVDASFVSLLTHDHVMMLSNYSLFSPCMICRFTDS